MLVEIIHTTTYTYTDDVVESVVEARLQPRGDSDQRLVSFNLKIDPTVELFSYSDGFANTVHSFTVLRPLRQLVLISRSRVDTLLANPFAPPLRTLDVPDEVDVWLYRQFTGPIVPATEVLAFADRFRPLEEADTLPSLTSVMQAIYDTFGYAAEVTSVSSTVEDLLELRRGVCQDFAHLMIAICRAMDIPARYVSGYIVARDDTSSRGDGASHAWCEAWVPGFGWRGFDPTNGVLAASNHVKVAYGRDYRDVPPTRGIYRGIATEQISVGVQTSQVRTSSSPHY